MKKYFTILLAFFLMLILSATHATGQIRRGTIDAPKTEAPKPAKEKPEPKKTVQPRKPNRGRVHFGSRGQRARTVLPGNDNSYRQKDNEEDDQEFDVIFRCSVNNATLFIDGYEAIDGPNSTISFEPGKYEISVEADGYEPCDTVIEVNRDGMEFDFVLVETALPLLIDDLDDDRHLDSQTAKTTPKPQIESQLTEDEPLSPLPATEESDEDEEPVIEEQQPVVETQEPTASPEPIPAPRTVEESPQEEIETTKLKTITVKGVSFTMVYVEGGTYMRYKIPDNVNQFVEGDVRTGVPRAHNVTVSDFYIGMYEVTNDLWYAVMADSVVNDGGLFPYDNASWSQCQVFIEKLNKMTGLEFRLPTDAEWEFAARGGVKSQGYVFAGSNNIEDVAWYNGNSDIEYHDVGTKEPNELGLYDMSGSVPEWCADWFWYWPGVDETTPALVNPVGEQFNGKRVNRGGGYGNDASECCVWRYFNDNPEAGRGMGLRLAL